MSRYSLSHLSDAALLRSLRTTLARERAATADVLAHLAEVDERRLYVPAGYPSLFAYCVGELHLSEDAAAKRIQAARAARRFPALFPALADGRLHLTGVGLLAPYLTAENVEELLAAAAGKSKAEIEQVLAARFPQSELLALVQSLGPASPGAGQHALAHVGSDGADGCQPALAHVGASVPPAKLAPIAPERYALQVSIGRETHELLCYARVLLGHTVPSGDLGAVLHQVLKVAVAQFEKQKFGATNRPQRHPRPSDDPRHIPAAVKRQVWERDGGRCTFTSDDCHRCEATSRLEYDHVVPLAQGGESTVGNLRLRCHAHNQHAAEQTFGPGFMAEKRRQAREAKAARAQAAAEPEQTTAERAQAEAEREQAEAERERAEAERAQAEAEREEAQTRARAEAFEAMQIAMAAQRERAEALARRKAAVDEVIPCLRNLGLGAGEARAVAETYASDPNVPFEDRVRAAISSLGRGRRVA